MDFSNEPISKENYYIFAKIGDTDISISDLTTFDGRNIGVLKDHLPEDVLNEWEKENNLHLYHENISTKEYTIERLNKQEIECFVSVEGSFWGEYGIAPVTSIGSSNIYFAVTKGRPELKKELDSAMLRISEEYPFFAEDLYKQYFTEASTPVLAKNEREWLAEHGVIRMGCLKNDGAISSVDSASGKIEGVITDYVRLAKNCIYGGQLEFELSAYDSRRELLDALHNGKIDAIFYVPQNPSSAEKSGYDLSETTLSTNMVALITEDLFDEEEENTVAIASGQGNLKSYITYNYPQWNIAEYETQEDVISAVKNGNADCFVAESNQSVEYTKNKGLNSFVLSKSNKASFAVDSGNIVLLSILNKTLKTVSVSKFAGLLNTRTNSMRKVTVSDFIKDNLWKTTAGFLFVFVLIISLFTVLLKKMRRAMVQAENANFAKTSFLNNMSHDIRTPINGIVGMLSIIKKNENDPEVVRDCLDKIEMSSDLLLSLVNDVLDMSKLDSASVILTNESVNLDELCAEITEAVSFQAEEAGIQVTNEHDDYTDVYIKTSPLHLKKILLNLFANAIKYNKENGSIHTSMRTIERTEDTIKCEFKIEDSGIGMSEEYVKKELFKPFSQAGNTARSRYNGSGLGLSIVKRIVEMMNGTILVKSKEGEGSCFTVILPFEIDHRDIARTQKTEEVSDVDISEMNLLLVEDNELNMEIAKMILEDDGAKITTAMNGLEALRKFEETEPGTFDAILMDIMMPEMDGLTATKKIRELERPDAKIIPIIAMTANAFAEDAKKCLDAGMNAHLAKPLDVEKVKKTLCEFVVRKNS